MSDAPKVPTKHDVGEAMQELMAKRGCNLTLEESRRFVLDLLHLIEIGLIVPTSMTATNTVRRGSSRRA